MSAHSRRPHFAYPTPPSTASTSRASGRVAYTSVPPVIPESSSTSTTTSGAEPQYDYMRHPSQRTPPNFQPYISASPLGRATIPLPPITPYYYPVDHPSEASIPSNPPIPSRARVNIVDPPERRRAHEPYVTQYFQPVIPGRHQNQYIHMPIPIRSTPCQLLNNVFSSNAAETHHHTLNPPSLHHELLRKARLNSTSGATTRFSCLRWDMRFPPSRSFGRDRCRYSILHYNRGGPAPVLSLSRPDYHANAFTIEPPTQILKVKSSDDAVHFLLNVSPFIIKWERGTELTVQELLKKLFEYLNTPLSATERRRLVHPADTVHLQRTCARRVHDVGVAALRYGQSLPKNLAEVYRVDLLGVNHGFYGFEMKYGKTQVELVLSVRCYDTNMIIRKTR